MAKDDKWIFKCPHCKKNINTSFEKTKELCFTVVECPRCFNVFEIQSDFSVKDFRNILIENSKKRKKKSNMNEKDIFEVVRII